MIQDQEWWRMKHATSMTFFDIESQDEGYVGIRYDDTTVALFLSLKKDGDLDVCMSKEDAKKLIEALKQATS
jgi:hypothetical protein